MNDGIGTETNYESVKDALYKQVDAMPLDLQLLDRSVLEERAARTGGKSQTLEQKCVNYLRHSASAYGDILRKLRRPDELGLNGIERHVLHIEWQHLMDRTKKRILDEIATNYPWLRAECRHQAWRSGLVGDPGDFILPFGPFKGRKLWDVSIDYLVRLLGQDFAKKSFRSCLEHHLVDRAAGRDKSRHRNRQSREGGQPSAKDNPVPDAVVERLKNSMLDVEDKDREQGKRAGHQWACESADAQTLLRLESLYEQMGNDWWQLFEDGLNHHTVAARLAFEMDPETRRDSEAAQIFWEKLVGKTDPSAEYVRAFIEEALDVWGEVKSRL